MEISNNPYDVLNQKNNHILENNNQKIPMILSTRDAVLFEDRNVSIKFSLDAEDGSKNLNSSLIVTSK